MNIGVDIDMSVFDFSIPSNDEDIDDLFTDVEDENSDDEKPSTDEPKRIQCPHCGEWIDLP